MPFQSKILILLFFCFSLSSCSLQKHESEDVKKTSTEFVIDNIIKNYYNNTPEYIREYDVFEVKKDLLSEEYYVFCIYPQRNYYRVRSEHIIGSYPNDFPTNYKLHKKKLFLWNDSEKPLENEVLRIMDKYEILDSIDYRYEVGIYFHEWGGVRNGPERRSIVINEKIKCTYYVICRNNVKKFKKKRSTGIYSIDDLPKPDCRH